MLTLAAISSPISQATLAPVFGAIPSAVNHKQAIIATCILGLLLNYVLPKPAAGTVGSYLAAWAFWIPVVQMYLFQYSSVLGPVRGPMLLGFLSCHTIIILASYAAAEASETLHLGARLGRYATPVLATGIGVFHFISFEGLFQNILPGLTTLSQAFTPVKMQLLVATTLTYLYPSKLVLLALPAMIHTFFANPHFDSMRTMEVLNTSLAAHNWTILDRRWSNTGYISVLESLDMQYRVMRCDHSLLGGEWLLTDERRKNEGWVVDESIYSVFEMLEAVRLIENSQQTPDVMARALVVGLGIGTAPKAFLSHGIKTTIVELDPIVHDFATIYFNLPSNHTSIIQDAVGWAAETSASYSAIYDYIIHDVFTGGAEPLSLFTEQFLRNLRSLLKPQGAIALNYAGDVHFPLTAKVLNTIDFVFDGQCKIFRDTLPAGEKAETNEDFTNIIIFCRNSPGPITFRKPTKGDLLGSKSREHYMLPDPQLEIPFSNAADRRDLKSESLQQGEEGRWSRQQADSAIKHWHVMRKVMPDPVWELW